MYGGDEVSAIVVDIGSTVTKAGYAGEESPKAVLPSNVGVLFASDSQTVGAGVASTLGEGSSEMEIDYRAARGRSDRKYYVGTTALSFRRDNMEIRAPLSRGLISDWEATEMLLDHAFKERLQINPAEHPVLFSEASYNPRDIREKLTELFFETYRVPALFLSKNGVLTCFASGRSSGLVLDSGGGVTVATPVHEGYALTKALLKTTLSGELLTEELSKFLQTKGIEVRPHWQITKKPRESVVGNTKFEVIVHDYPNTTESYRQWSRNNIVRDLKESVCRVSESRFDESANANIPTVGYELPDGTQLEVGTERFRIPEYLFDPSLLPNPLPTTDEWPLLPMHRLVHDTISRCDIDIRRELFNGVIISGGNSLLPGFTERLQRELRDLAPQKIKLIATSFAAERKYGAFIGGSILASLGTFQQLWMSKQEYQEHGKHLVERKCP